jgi:hypothetical protein
MADGTWGECVGEVLPQTETCNGLDDDCDGDVDNGFDLLNDVNNCGTCGHVCSLPNATAGCVNGQCTIVACDEGWADCDGNPANGCERAIVDDNENCGCGVNCEPGGICQNGVCVSNCEEGTTCLIITYNPDSGQCVQVPAASGTPCGTGGTCDGSGTCVE